MAVNIFSLPSASALLLFSLAFGVIDARPWHGATKTAVYKRDEWSPRPTQVVADPAKLFKRKSVDVAVCGWIGGNSASPVSCGSGSSCVHDTSHGFIGCCATSGPCTAGVYSSCIDDSNSHWSENSGVQLNGVTTCPSNSACYRNTYAGGYFQYNCGSPDQATTVQTSFSGQPTDLRLQIVFTGVNFSPTSTATSSSSSSSSTSSSTSSSESSSETPTSTNHNPPGTTSTNSVVGAKPSTTSSTNPAGATAVAASTTTAAAITKSHTVSIIGGVVGGLALLTLILGILLFFLQRRHAERSKQRAGSFISGHKHGAPPPTGPFQRIGPYSPDDFNATMTERATPSTIAANFPNNHLTPPEPAAQAFFSPPQPPLQDIREDEPLVSEIDDFSRSFNEHMETSRFQDGPYPVLSGQTSSEPLLQDGGVAGIGAPLLRRSGSSDSGSGEDKESGRNFGYETAPGFRSENVRQEGWAPATLKPREFSIKRKQVSVSSREPEPQRYQLVDAVPSSGVPVLHSPGQLRGNRAVGRGKRASEG